ncbi:MAG: dTDP-4-dehydrorhamnose 3,5-epimerase [Elusimicrobia bacterium GWA2_56_46]|nr:MAG: dTDP-4-dehydrorhamnose 3,5-epimerase [Elusimicrobia bacterium GWA2_56_46]OGR53702.1 MAG: dTDP-4-dehydrorhamnose 3,5-epimerase [Elusimicrobia bacterium GWC2_56_31]HBB66822.1 dTDP-4-dehydrorhamnose 3,5-epimerase [Elusimicrobiota bacterium]HBW23159.1 dTDP-4-dehydrorhamnose 3,5-epimerase [Elusimicrobiota bacterium]
MPFEFEKLEPAGLVLVKPKVFLDDRGFFVESYKKSDFEKAGIREEFVQDNHSKSVKGVLRGLHYQKDPFAQGKLVRCLSGRVLDVAVDIRRASPSFGKWAAIELNSDSANMLYIPPGFAHGFLVLSETAEIMYKCTKEFSPAHDAGIRWDDPRLGIEWGIKAPVLSAKDSALPLLEDAA